MIFLWSFTWFFLRSPKFSDIATSLHFLQICNFPVIFVIFLARTYKRNQQFGSLASFGGCIWSFLVQTPVCILFSALGSSSPHHFHCFQPHLHHSSVKLLPMETCLYNSQKPIACRCARIHSKISFPVPKSKNANRYKQWSLYSWKLYDIFPWEKGIKSTSSYQNIYLYIWSKLTCRGLVCAKIQIFLSRKTTRNVITKWALRI